MIDVDRYSIIFQNNFNKKCQLWLLVYMIKEIYEKFKANKSILDYSCINEVSIDEGNEEDDYYIAFVDMTLYKYYSVDYDGIIAVDMERIPKLTFSKENFDCIEQSVIQIFETKPMYLVIKQTDDGWIDLWGRNELSDQEKQMVRKFEIDTEKWKEEERKRVLARQEQEKN